MPVINPAFYKKYAHKVKTEHFSLLRPANYLPADSTYHMLLPDEPGIYVVQVVPDDKKGQNCRELPLSHSFQSIDYASLN